MEVRNVIGLPVSVDSTVPARPADSPLILLIIGGTAISLQLPEAGDLANQLKGEVRKVGASGQVVFQIDDTKWNIESAGASRIANAISSEIAKAGRIA